MDRLVKLWRLSGAERQLLIESWWRLVVAAVAVRALPFPWVAARAARLPAATRRRRNVDVDCAARLIAVAGNHHPLAVRCLERALALQWLLARRGLATELKIGVLRHRGPLQAHAWLEFGGKPLDAGQFDPGYRTLQVAGGRTRV